MAEGSKAGVAISTVKPRRTRLYAAAWSAVSIVLAAVFTARAFAARGEPVPDELWFVWIGSLFDAVWVFGVELRAAWSRISHGRASAILIGPMAAATLLASFIDGSGCTPRPIVVRDLTWEVSRGSLGPPSCVVRLIGDGKEIGRWSAAKCPERVELPSDGGAP